jgi:hypothetical protein
VYIQAKGDDGMQSDKNNQSDQSKELADLDLKDVDSFMHHQEKLYEKLQSETYGLPKVDDKGHSECPFAEDLYFRKEQAVDEVTKALKRASGYRILLKQEIARIRKNLEKIHDDAGSLHLDEAKEKYAQAIQAQEIPLEKNIQRQKRLVDLISKGKKLLRLDKKNKWPLGKPKKRFHPPPLTADGPNTIRKQSLLGPSTVDPVSSKPDLQNELDRLMNLGPLGNKNIEAKLF